MLVCYGNLKPKEDILCFESRPHTLFKKAHLKVRFLLFNEVVLAHKGDQAPVWG